MKTLDSQKNDLEEIDMEMGKLFTPNELEVIQFIGFFHRKFTSYLSQLCQF